MSTALLVSLCFVLGVALVISAVPRPRQPRLADRLDPYLRGLIPPRSRLLAREEAPLTPFPAFERLLRPLVGEGAAWSIAGPAARPGWRAACARRVARRA